MGRFFVAFRAIVAFMGRWGWTFVACTVFLCFYYLWSVWVGLLRCL